MKLKVAAIVILISIVAASCVYYIDHNPQLAVETAEQFSEAAFVKRDFQKASSYLPKNNLPNSAESKIETMVMSMHPSSQFPTVVHAIGYEIMSGKRITNVFLAGNPTDKPNYYCIVLSGDSNGYVVTEMYRQEEPFPRTSQYKSLN